MPGQYQDDVESLKAWREQEESPDIQWIKDGPLGSYACVPNELLVGPLPDPDEDPDVDLRDRVRSLVDPDLEEEASIEIETRAGPRTILHYSSPLIQVDEVLQKTRDAHDRDLLIPRIGANLVFTGEPEYQGFPSCWPTPEVPPFPDYSSQGDGPIVAVLDTRYTVGNHEANGLDSRFLDSGPANISERLDVKDSGWRDFEAGHSTFICGIIAERARRARIRLVPTLNSLGRVSEKELAQNIQDLPRDVDIVNLSLGGFSPGDVAPIALTTAIASLPAETAVVAAAGNAGPTDRPFWPARLDQAQPCGQKVVFAVGALAEDGSTKTADYSTDPADLYAPGRATSAFVWFDETVKHSAAVLGRTPYAFDGYASWAGTSFATAVVAARIAEEMADGRSALAVARDLCQNVKFIL